MRAEPIEVPWSDVEDYQCFGCSPHNPHGLRLEFETDPDGIRARFRLGRRYESYPGIVHGGLAGVICDETMGNLVVLTHGRSAYTTSLRMRYLAPLLVDVDYTCVATGRSAAAGLYQTSAEIRDTGEAVMAVATASYRPFDDPRHHTTRHRDKETA